MLICVYTSEVKTNNRSLSVLEYKRSICIMYRWNFVKSVWQKFDMYKEILCTQKNVMGLTPWRRPIGLKAVSQGIMLLSIPMVFSVYTDETENEWSKFICVYMKRIGYVQRKYVCT